MTALMVCLVVALDTARVCARVGTSYACTLAAPAALCAPSTAPETTHPGYGANPVVGNGYRALTPDGRALRWDTGPMAYGLVDEPGTYWLDGFEGPVVPVAIPLSIQDERELLAGIRKTVTLQYRDARGRFQVGASKAITLDRSSGVTILDVVRARRAAAGL